MIKQNTSEKINSFLAQLAVIIPEAEAYRHALEDIAVTEADFEPSLRDFSFNLKSLLTNNSEYKVIGYDENLRITEANGRPIFNIVISKLN